MTRHKWVKDSRSDVKLHNHSRYLRMMFHIWWIPFQDDDDEDESDDEDETAELLAELQKIKKERAMEKQKLVGIYWGFFFFFLSHCLFFLNSILIFLICSSFFHSTSFIVHLNIPGGSFHKAILALLSS